KGPTESPKVPEQDTPSSPSYTRSGQTGKSISQSARGPATHPTEAGKLGSEGSHTMVATMGAGEEQKQYIEGEKHLSPEGGCNRQQQPATTPANAHASAESKATNRHTPPQAAT